MGASNFEFRLRMPIMVAIIFFGFWSPWVDGYSFANRIPLFAWLALVLSRLGLISFAVATPLMIALAALIAAQGALLRIWGSAWLGYGIVHHRQMQAGAVMADGPYRYVRNPLYLGSWCSFAAMAFLMPPTGSLFAMTLLTLFLLRLILGEEAFLSSRLGETYHEYLRAVPRLFPQLSATLPPTHRKPQWLRAIITEIHPIGVFVTLALFSWSYNSVLMVKLIIVSFGLSLIVRALVPSN
jgi:protein-S-isoprenylcysteine O-methyltransferase Ste14